MLQAVVAPEPDKPLNKHEKRLKGPDSTFEPTNDKSQSEIGDSKKSNQNFKRQLVIFFMIFRIFVLPKSQINSTPRGDSLRGDNQKNERYVKIESFMAEFFKLIFM